MWTSIATFVAVADEALRQSAAAESDRRSWLARRESVVFCIRPSRDEDDQLLLAESAA